MNLSNILAISIETMGGFGSPFSLNWLGKIVEWLINSCNSIGLGIILFTLCIKLVTLPFDIISRTSMKKNNLKMKQMRPQLEKLQRQYANNKELYNKKMQALYKSQGISMFSSCLPTIITLIFFILVINQFSAYSNKTNLEIFNKMSNSYNQAIETIDDSIVYKELDADGNIVGMFLNEKSVFNNKEDFSAYKEYIQIVEKSGNKAYEATFKATDVDKFGDLVESLNQKGYNEVKVGEDTNTCHIIKNGNSYSFNPNMYQNLTTDEINEIATTKVLKNLLEDYKTANVLTPARNAAEQTYLENAPSFLWIKNLWMADLPFKHPVNKSLSDYDFARNLENKDTLEKQFNEITFNLTEEKKQPNGFFVLVILSIGTMFLSQLLMTKTQKDQLELQSVDGQGMSQSKMMMWIMPIMFGVFAFMYSASFSLYMTVSTLFSMISTIAINYFVELSFKNKYGQK